MANVRRTNGSFGSSGPTRAREAILQAGAVSSPHILQLSRVADPEHLGKIDVPVAHELHGSGKNVQGHYTARVSYRWSAPRPPTSAHAVCPLTGQVARWLLTGKGILT
jgi:choline dehydrogenase